MSEMETMYILRRKVKDNSTIDSIYFDEKKLSANIKNLQKDLKKEESLEIEEIILPLKETDHV